MEHIRSYYAASAHPSPQRPALRGETTADVCVIGGGIAGCSTALHLAERGYQVIEGWLAATLERLRTCGCATGCPACVVSPKCGNGNQPLEKSAAADLLSLLVG